MYDETILHNMFFDSKHYELSSIELKNINTRLNLKENSRFLTLNMIQGMLKQIILSRKFNVKSDNIDSLSFKRIKSVDESLYQTLNAVF